MSRYLRAITILLVGAAVIFAAIIVKELTTPQRSPRRAATVTRTAPAPPPAQAPAPAPPAGAYGVITARNLFSPTRTEAPPPPATAAAPVAINLPKPNLYGVVLQEGTPIAYLEDPVTKRVARYRIGDNVAGGTLRAISPDSVMLSRPDGQINVRLHDPTRPRPAAPPVAPAAGAPIPGAPIPAPGAFPGAPAAAPGVTGGPPATFQPRRALPPGVLGRVPPRTNDATTTE